MKGIFFIATGKKYQNELLNAIKRTREVMPNIPIAVCSDYDYPKLIKVDYFIKIENPLFNFADKVNNFMLTPFDKTLFLDTDTYIVDSVEPIFEILDRFDIVAPHAPIEEDELVDVPEVFVEMNSGVIAFNKNPRVEKMFNIYKKHYLHSLSFYLKRDNDIPPDQPSFRYAIYKSKVNFTFLPHEYNCMLDYPCLLSSKVHILHGHYSPAYFENKAKEVNKSLNIRLYLPEVGLIKNSGEFQ